MGNADLIFNGYLTKKQEIQDRQARRFSEFLRNGEAIRDLRDGAKAYELLQQAEVEDVVELNRTAELTAAALYDIVRENLK